eukprot:CAMPEP_0167760934 /NCGR_PEP_ID=MMETSP0110_2-20121227/11871_1 /TAXON_ID=629695 /ORGANISM="Gymnochlora sp., Strain CCMP2014" /LENGTH=61 /DNA_ID=CAMNT_0007647519 /DNA_START=111 /DNA_END=296 /DNA_ORIENTATION=-
MTGNYVIGAGLILFVSGVYYRSISAVSRNASVENEIAAVQAELDQEREIEMQLQKERESAK